MHIYNATLPHTPRRMTFKSYKLYYNLSPKASQRKTWRVNIPIMEASNIFLVLLNFVRSANSSGALRAVAALKQIETPEEVSQKVNKGVLLALDLTRQSNFNFFRKVILDLTENCPESLKHKDVKGDNVLTKILKADINESQMLDLIEELLNTSSYLDVNAEDGKELTALHYAVQSRLSRVAEMLISRGCNVNAFGDLERSPLLFAVLNTDLNMFELLINKGCEVEVQGLHGESLLSYAAASLRLTPCDSPTFETLIKMCETLIEEGCSLKDPIAANRTLKVEDVFLERGLLDFTTSVRGLGAAC